MKHTQKNTPLHKDLIYGIPRFFNFSNTKIKSFHLILKINFKIDEWLKKAAIFPCEDINSSSNF